MCNEKCLLSKGSREKQELKNTALNGSAGHPPLSKDCETIHGWILTVRE